MARQKRLLDQEEDEFAERLANARKREEIVRRKEKGRVIKKAVRQIIISGRMSIYVVKLVFIFQLNLFLVRHYPREENWPTQLIRIKEIMKIGSCQKMAQLMLMMTKIYWKICRMLFESKSNSQSRSRSFPYARLCALISSRADPYRDSDGA